MQTTSEATAAADGGPAREKRSSEMSTVSSLFITCAAHTRCTRVGSAPEGKVRGVGGALCVGLVRHPDHREGRRGHEAPQPKPGERDAHADGARGADGDGGVRLGSQRRERGGQLRVLRAEVEEGGEEGERQRVVVVDARPGGPVPHVVRRLSSAPRGRCTVWQCAMCVALRWTWAARRGRA